MAEISKLDAAIKRRANERVQQKIKTCQQSLGAALLQLQLDQYGAGRVQSGYNLTPDSAIRAVLNCVLSSEPNKGWPVQLWRAEEEKVAEEIMNIMDPLQRALAAKEPGPDDATPKEDEAGADK